MAEDSKPAPKRTARAASGKAPQRKAAAKTASTATAKVATARKPRAKAKVAVSRADIWREQAGAVAEQAKTTARSAANTAKNSTGSALHGLSKLISDTADTVDSRLGPQYGDYARQAAETVAGAAQSLDATDVDQLAEDAREFVRKSPAVAIGAAAIVGFVLMRLARGGSSGSGSDSES